jgi:hypothetical protein
MFMSIDPILADFVASEIPGAIVLQGKWGVGKTFLWRHKVLPLVFDRPGKKRYSYVSLFSIGSLDELKTALAVATEESDQEAEHNEKWFRRAKRKLNRAQPMAADIVSFVPTIGGDLARFVEKLGYFMIRGRIICFDDIERRGDGLPLKDFLGLVSYLVEQRNCRIVVILNTGELGEHQSDWDRMREKVFDGELTYAPSIRETIDLGLSDSVSAPWAETLRQSLLTLSVSNIRLVRRTVGFMKRALEVRGTAELRPGTVEHIAKALAILIYSVHGQGEGAPPIDHVMNPHLLSALGSAASNGTELSAEELRWRNVVQGYGLYLHTPLDKALLAMVQAGYPDPAMLIEAINEVEQNASRYEAIDAFHAAWDLYHNTVAENGTEIVAAFERTWPPASASEHAQNLQGMVRILRLLDRADLATRFINQWVEERWGKRRLELSPGELHLFRQVEDEEILGAVEQVKLRPIDLMPLQAAFEEIRSSEGYPEHAIASLAAATDAEILSIIDNNPGEGLSRTLKKVIELPHNSYHPEWAIAATQMETTCRRIAARSPLNADRINNWFGLEPLS